MKTLTVQKQQALEQVLGTPVSWESLELRTEASRALEIRQQSLDRGLSKQVRLQENYLRALAFLNNLVVQGIRVTPLDGNYKVQNLGAQLLPPIGLKILQIMGEMDHPLKIEGWAILTPQRRVDPYLAFKIAGRWYSVLQWV